jgi:hypothetical protein
VQLTSTADAEASPGASRERAPLLSRLNHPIATGLIALAGWLGFAVFRWHRWAHGHITKFIMAGKVYTDPAQMFPKIAHVTNKGYDGQFYYRLALNPFNWHRTAYGITMDHPYRYTRIGFPLVAWALSLGGHGRLLPTVLVVINIVCMGIIAFLGAKFARDAGRHALWGLLFAGYFGLVVSVGRDMSEPLADSCMLGGLLAYRRNRYLLAAGLIGYAAITNEPVLALPVAIALVRLFQMFLRRVRPGLPDLVWVVPGAAYVLLQGIQKLVVKGTAGGVSDASANLTLPFKAMIPGVYRDIVKSSGTYLGKYDINLIEFIVLATFVVVALLVIRSTTAPVHERAGFIAFVVLEMVIASGQFWDSTFGDGRTFVDTFLMAVLIIVSTPAGTVADKVRGAHASLYDRVFSPNRVITNKQLAWLAGLAAIALLIVARRRVMFQ